MKQITPQRPGFRFERLVMQRVARDPRAGVEPLDQWLTQEWLTSEFNAGLTPNLRRPYAASKACLERVKRYVIRKINENKKPLTHESTLRS